MRKRIKGLKRPLVVAASLLLAERWAPTRSRDEMVLARGRPLGSDRDGEAKES
jgi:hypothetical protein